jgi:hypothetical protein
MLACGCADDVQRAVVAQMTCNARWQRRNEPMMQRADILSKVGTEWALRESYVTATTLAHSLPVLMPDLAQADKAINALITRRQAHTLILPRWEGKSWWQLVLYCPMRQCMASQLRT